MTSPTGRPTATHRRGFLQALAAGAAAIALRPSLALAADPAGDRAGDLEPDRTPSDAWLAKIHGKYRQVFDCTSPNSGFGPVFALNFIDSTREATRATDRDISAVVVLRHFSMPLALDDATWAKYHIGEAIGVIDPATNAPATKNIFRSNILLRPGLTYEKMMSDRGVIVTACNMALTVLSGMTAPKAGVTADVAKQDWLAGLLPGVYLATSGVYAVNRSQQAGCTYCTGG